MIALAKGCTFALATMLVSGPVLAKPQEFPIKLVSDFCFEDKLSLEESRAAARTILGRDIWEQTEQPDAFDLWKAVALSSGTTDEQQPVKSIFVGLGQGRAAPQPTFLRITGSLDGQRILELLRLQQALRLDAVERVPNAIPPGSHWGVRGIHIGKNKTSTQVTFSVSKLTTVTGARTTMSDTYVFTCRKTNYLGQHDHQTDRHMASLAALSSDLQQVTNGPFGRS